MVEKFNDRWQQFGPLQHALRSRTAVDRANGTFEDRHNAHYRYSKLGGRTPNAALAATAARLRFPDQPTAPRHPLPKPAHGRYHLIRFVRTTAASICSANRSACPQRRCTAYVRATVDVGRERLIVVLDGKVIDQHTFLIR